MLKGIGGINVVKEYKHLGVTVISNGIVTPHMNILKDKVD